MKIEQTIEDSELTVFIDPQADRFSDKETENSQNGMQIVLRDFYAVFAEISTERFSYVDKETFRKA